MEGLASARPFFYSGAMPRKIEVPRIDIDPRAPYARELNWRLQNPDPTMGWTGDPEMYCGFETLYGQWMIFTGDPNNPTLVARAPQGERLDMVRLIKGLVERDQHIRGHKSVTEAVIKHNQDVEASHRRVMEDATRETLDKLYHQWAKDDGHNHGYVAPISLHNPKR